MSSLIFCAHTDDAIFSLGDYIIDNNNTECVFRKFWIVVPNVHHNAKIIADSCKVNTPGIRLASQSFPSFRLYSSLSISVIYFRI